MQWELVVALVIAVPLILFPAAYIWYVNIGGITAAIKQAREARAARKEKAGPKGETLQEQEYVSAVIEAIKRYPWRR